MDHVIHMWIEPQTCWISSNISFTQNEWQPKTCLKKWVKSCLSYKILTGSFSADLRGFLEELEDEEWWLEWLDLDLDEDDVLDVDLWDTLFRIMTPSNMWHRFSSSPEKHFQNVKISKKTFCFHFSSTNTKATDAKQNILFRFTVSVPIPSSLSILY